MTGKIVALTDALGNPVAFELLPGQRHDSKAVAALIEGHIYRWRHLIENFFQKLKEFRRIATRYDKTDKSYRALLYACSTVINTR